MSVPQSSSSDAKAIRRAGRVSFFAGLQFLSGSVSVKRIGNTVEALE
jgi:hypothetical protein